MTVRFKGSKPYQVFVVREILPKQGLCHRSQTDWRRSSEIYPNKSEVAKSMKMCTGGMTFVEVLEVTTRLVCFEKFLQCRFIVIGRSAITFRISCLKRKEIFNFSCICKTRSQKRFVLSAGFTVTQGLKMKLLREAIEDN